MPAIYEFINNDLNQPVSAKGIAYTKIAPIIMVQNDSGVVDVMRYTPAGTAQSGRDACGNITINSKAFTSVSYTTVEKLMANGVDNRKVGQFGGLEDAKYSIAKGALLSVQKAIDTAVATAFGAITETTYATGTTLYDAMFTGIFLQQTSSSCGGKKAFPH